MSSHISQWRCRVRLVSGGLACVLEEGRVGGSTTSGTTGHFCPSPTGTKISQVQTLTHADIKRIPYTIIPIGKTPMSILSVDSGDGTCVAMTTGPIGGFWDDKECLEKHAFVCEKPRPDITPPTKAPTFPPSQGCATSWTALPHFRNCFKVKKAVE